MPPKESISKREANKINCHEQILRASRRLFTSNGYDETMMKDIAKKAKVSKATVYNYFPSKESLLSGTLDEVMEEAEQAVAASADSPADERMRIALETFVLGSMKYPELARRITYLNSCETSDLYGSTDRIFTLFEELIEEAKEKGIFKEDAPRGTILDMVMGIYYIVQFQWIDIEHMSSVQLLDRLREYFDMIIRPYYR